MTHDAPRRDEPVPRLADALAIVREAPRGPTVLMLDAKDGAPWSSETVAVDQDVALTFDPQYYLEAKGSDSPLPGRDGAYGYHDAHPLAFRRTVPPAAYLRERVAALLHLVPGIREFHVRLALFEQMEDDGFNVIAAAHDAGVLVDLWTLDAGTPRWHERLVRALDAGTDILTTNTPRELSRAVS
ncbi:MAG: hypothetical protein E6J38_08665 [Chloroflexi bacterium]|nr:MAG: hypothetical protein E6J38_08665 [Chloroflexota bacterium]